jgi:hypothetical protein
LSGTALKLDTELICIKITQQLAHILAATIMDGLFLKISEREKIDK